MARQSDRRFAMWCRARSLENGRVADGVTGPHPRPVCSRSNVPVIHGVTAPSIGQDIFTSPISSFAEVLPVHHAEYIVADWKCKHAAEKGGRA